MKQINNKGNALMILGTIIGVVLLIALIIAMWIFGSYNSLVQKDTNVEQKWGNVQTAYQRRFDLIPNLVETVKGAKNFEQETQTQIAKLRSEAGQAQVAAGNAQTPADLAAANQMASSVLSRLLVIVEAYPDLKSNQNFLALQDEITGSENRIAFERNNYNIAVQDYRAATRVFPTNIIAGMFGFDTDKWKPFQADDTAQNAPKVSFS